MAKQKKTELEQLRPKSRFVTLRDGSKYEILPTGLGQEQEIMLAAKNLAIAAFQAGLIGGGEPLEGETAALRLIELLLGASPKELAHVAGAICNQDEDWAKQNLDLEGAIDVIVPFFKTKLPSVMKKLMEYTDQQQVTTLIQNTRSQLSSTSSPQNTESVH